MKKTIKRILALLALLSMLFSLSGCMYLDELRKFHGFWGENGTILWDNTAYKELPAHQYLHAEGDPESSGVYVTEPDVPVLLSFSGDYYRVSTDKLFLLNGTQVFCRVERFQEISDRLAAPFDPQILCYTYSTFDTEQNKSIEHRYDLTREQQDALSTVIKNTEPQTPGDGWTLRWDSRVELWECSEDMLLRNNCMALSQSGITYYLYLYPETPSDATKIFTVPTELNSVCADIMEEYVNRFRNPEFNQDAEV